MIQSITIQVYQEKYKEQIIDLILHIQQKEFNVPVSIEDQPDLLHIPNFYQQKKGNFWIAVEGEEVIGTIALIDIENHQGVIRKMFVKKEYRGKEFGIAQKLLDTLIDWSLKNQISEIMLGTINRLDAAIRFYEKNNFFIITKNELPPSFPIMPVDNLFMKINL